MRESPIMAWRAFTAADGTQWTVWDVVREVSPGDFVRPGTERGWIVFECADERRRLAPVPDGWSELPDQGLSELLEQAKSVRRPPRLIE